ncbi:MAG: hypothetical protein V4555_04670 [Acidobacteriota bacterium]
MPIETTSHEVSASIVDLDRLESWPAELTSEITPLLPAIRAEQQASLASALSGEHWHRPSPPTPSTQAAHEIVRREMASRRIRVFHTTRLLDFDAVRREGLRPLDLEQQIGTMKKVLVATQRFTTLEELGRLISTVDIDDGFFRNREGQVWATPLRRLLHDGGCAVFFDHWGGEAIQRLAHMASDELEAAIQALGTPAVVTFTISAFGCCTFSDWRLPPTMIGLMLESAGFIERNTEAWDVLVKRAIPSEWIESVLPRDDPSLSAKTSLPGMT